MRGSNDFISSAIIEKVTIEDMIYRACPRCFRSLDSWKKQVTGYPSSNGTSCVSCGLVLDRSTSISYKYRMQITISYDFQIEQAILFDEVAEKFLGCPATQMKKLCLRYEELSYILEDLLVGLRVSLVCQKGQDRKQNGFNQVYYKKDMKILNISPLSSVLLPRSPMSLAMELLTKQHSIKNVICGPH